MSLQPVIIQWGVSSYSGWGVNGLNIALNWIRDDLFAPVCSMPVRTEELALSPLEWQRMGGFLRNSAAFCEQLAPHPEQEIGVSIPVLRGLGNNLVGSRSVGRTVVTGQPTVGVCYLEDTALTDEARERAKACTEILAGSTFVRNTLEGAGIACSRVVLQGVDPTHFHPAPRAGWFRDRFTVFSGGKPETRKGQDLVLLAFRAFARRHPDALLLTAWHSPWPASARSLDANPALAPVEFLPDGRFNAAKWATDNGVAADQVIDLGHVPNADMARILREADVGLFPNRGEGGTNLVAMECMACGVPTVLSANTGHLDLIGDGNVYPLTRQRPVLDQGCDGWGESDVEEIVETLETIWAGREAAARVGERGATFMAGLTWKRYAAEIAEVIRQHL
ncbi:glycosyltransferase family 4 protein [Azospirillum doebereinerae]|nr:glycosyltransferase family 4 protein [Azospirillum doebereinerae]